MSLFKTKNVWSVYCENDETFDQNSMIVSPLNSDADFIIIGSHHGVLRIFQPMLDINEGILQTGFKASDLILEKLFDNPILQLGVGRLVSGSGLNHLAILQSKLISVYSLVVKEGLADHGIQYVLKLMYAHALKRSAANFTLGHFGGTLNRDFICVQSLDGLLTIFEQESYGFCCFISVFLLPGPLVYLKKTDSFITSGSNWYIQCFKYKNLYDAGHRTPDEEPTSTSTSILSDWDFQMNEPVLEMSVEQLPTKEFVVMVLGEQNLYCLSEAGKLKYMKRFDFSPLCFVSYVLDNNIMTIVISETNTVLIYQNTTLKWSAQLHFLPINVKRANLWNLKGCLVLLSDDGRLECSYLGTEPSLFVAPPLNYQELDFEKAEEELATLNKVIKDLSNDEVKLSSDYVNKQFTINLMIDPELKTGIHEHNLSMALNNQMCQLTIDIMAHNRIEELQLTILVRRPLKCIPATFFKTDVKEKLQFTCDIFLDEELEIPNLNCEVVASFISDSGTPRNVRKTTEIPLGLVVKFSPPEKDNEVKVNLNVNRDLVPLSVLFSDFSSHLHHSISDLMQDNPVEAAGNAAGFANVTECGKTASVLLAKSSQRYRIQSDSLVSLNLMVEQMVYRLGRYFQDDEGFSINFSGSLPISPLISCVHRHFQVRTEVVRLQEQLSVLSSQYRLIEKRLVAKLKAKTPIPLTNLGILLDDTFTEISTTTEKFLKENSELRRVQVELECCLNAVLCLMRLMNVDKKSLSVIESIFQPFVHDIENQYWEDVIECDLQYLLRTFLAKSEKDKLRAECSSFEEVKYISKMDKHLTLVLERISKKIIMETPNTSEERGSPFSIKEEEPPIGLQIGKSSSRILSARARASTISRVPESTHEENEEV
ncbi:protein PTHB1 [Coccinella septempunctata]|uniref:protein PTHB1 n=1 Tax=Coccinella septempunctata TaxID=41139 RepID=UPI001D07F261|nr:protein PTHB1 [Coccinella septempunctata]